MSKIINLNNKKNIIIPNSGEKYSTLLEQFIKPFLDDFKDEKYYDTVFEFAINAWNSANLKLLFPEAYNDSQFDELKKNGVNVKLLKKMIAYKITHFEEFTNFIVDYELDINDDVHKLTVLTQEEETFLAEVFDEKNFEENRDNFDENLNNILKYNGDYEENFIDRSAVIIKPLQPFVDWYFSLYSEEDENLLKAKTYLINDEITDIDSWLIKKFDKIFTSELEYWHENKKEWPQKRNYKMFKEWFEVVTSEIIFDLESKPISKI